MSQKNRQFDFLHDYIIQVLADCGYNDLSEDLKRDYVPQFIAHAETRIGAELLPLLKESMAKDMANLLKSDRTAPEEWAKFWAKNVPNYQDIVQKVLTDFAVELKQILADVKK